MHSSSSQQSSLQNLPFRNDTQRPIGTQGTKQSDSKIKRSRAGKPKAKTGCFTCRIRRVKCDESRPCCQRCTKFGVICDGYPTRPEGAVAPAIDRRPLHRLQPKALVPIPRSGVFGIRPASQFESEQELRYFRIFCEETATQIAGPFKSSLWNRLVPQASELEPFVRHSMVAIGAITKVSKDARKSRASGEDGGHQNLHMEHQYALKQYDKALKGMRDATARGEHDLRTALIACLLAFCFETLQGRQGPACALAVSGLSLFHQRVGRSDMNSPGSPRSSYCLEEEIINALASLDIQVLFFLDGRSLALHQQIIDDTTEALKLMPAKFSSLDKARFFWQIIIRRNFHFKAKAQSIGKAAELGGKREHLSWKETADFPVGEVPFSKLKDPSPEIRCEAQKYIMDIHKWTKAASNIFKTISRSDQNSIIVASLLQIHAKMSLITLAGMTFSDETSFDAFLPDFRAIVNLSSNIHPQLIESSQNSGLYQFDLGFLPALYLVGTRCRDKVVRAKAIDLLYSSPYREGIWDSGAVANLSNWTRSVEIACNDGNEEYIPEHNRVFLTAANVDLYNRRVKVYGTQRRGKTEADLVFHEGLLNW